MLDLGLKKFLAFCGVFIVYLTIAISYGKTILVDGVQYLIGARDISSGLSLATYPTRPLHQLSLAVVGLLSKHNLFAFRFFVTICSLAAVYLFYLVLKIRFSDKNSLLGALLFSSTLVFISLSGTVMSGNVAIMLSILALFLYFRRGSFYHLQSGFVLGLAFLLRETSLILFSALFLHLLYKREFRKLFSYAIVFSIPILLYSLFSFVQGEPNPWIGFYLYNVDEYQFEWSSNLIAMVKFFFLSLTSVGVFGLLGLFEKLRKSSLSDDFDFVFLAYSLFSIVTFFAWPALRIRFFLALAPSMSYFILESRRLRSLGPRFLALIVLVNFVVGVPLSLVYLYPHGVTVDAVDWIMANIRPDERIFSADFRIYYILGQEGFNVSNDYRELYQRNVYGSENSFDYSGIDYVVDINLRNSFDSTLLPSLNKTLVKSFKRPFLFGSIAHKKPKQFYTVNLYSVG